MYQLPAILAGLMLGMLLLWALPFCPFWLHLLPGWASKCACRAQFTDFECTTLQNSALQKLENSKSCIRDKTVNTFYLMQLPIWSTRGVPTLCALSATPISITALPR